MLVCIATTVADKLSSTEYIHMVLAARIFTYILRQARQIRHIQAVSARHSAADALTLSLPHIYRKTKSTLDSRGRSAPHVSLVQAACDVPPGIGCIK